MPQSAEAGGSGSSAATSRPAPAMRRAASASTRAASSTTRPRDVDEMGRGAHPAEGLGIDQVLGLLGQRTGERDEICLGQERVELVHSVHCIRRAAAGQGIPPQPDDMHIEGLGEPAEASPDIAQTDDEERLAPDLVLTLGEIADHSAPHPFCLIVTRLGEPAAQCEDQRHRVLRDRARIDAAGAGQAYSAPL